MYGLEEVGVNLCVAVLDLLRGGIVVVALRHGLAAATLLFNVLRFYYSGDLISTLRPLLRYLQQLSPHRHSLSRLVQYLPE